MRFAADIVEKIDINRNTAQQWLALAREGRDVPVKRTVALAMSAVVHGLKPWDEYGGSVMTMQNKLSAAQAALAALILALVALSAWKGWI